MQAISFYSIYKERIWGGRKLETIYKRDLPSPDSAFGEAWEIVDREDAQSIVEEGSYAGKSLAELWSHHREEIFGSDVPASERFPLLIKILDSADDLSVQVHPPAKIAATLNGEPKTEMWFIADRLPHSKLYVGLKKNISKGDFEQAIQDGTVAEKIHAIEPQNGESIFIESGRLHAIGAGFLIHEIQQNSDTTYRVFDWNRTDTEGNPRQLHVEQSLACIDFEDSEPPMDQVIGKLLADCPYFRTTRDELEAGETIGNPQPNRFSLLIIVSGKLGQYTKGRTILLPVGVKALVAAEKSQILQITIPSRNLK